MKKFLLFIAIAWSSLSSCSLDEKWLENFESGDFSKCYFTLSDELSAKDKEIIKNKVDQAIQKIKNEHKPIFCKTVDNDLLLFGGLQLTAILVSIPAFMANSLIWVIFFGLKRESFAFEKSLANKGYGPANSNSRLFFALSYDRTEQLRKHISKVAIGSTLLSSLLSFASYKFWRKYQNTFSKVIQLRVLNNIKDVVET